MTPVADNALISIDRLRDPRENTAWAVLAVAAAAVWVSLAVLTVASNGVVLFYVVIIWLFGLVAENLAAAHIRANGILVSDRQFPELNGMVADACARLQMSPPAVYVMQESVWNAFALKVAGRRYVVLFSGALDSVLLRGEARQLSFLVGHELGHHAAGHLDLRRRWAELGGWMVWLYFRYSRMCEYTCDRVGLYCSGDTATSLAAMSNMAAGAHFGPRVNFEAVAEQWARCKGGFFVKYRNIYSTHPHLLARLVALPQAAEELMIPQSSVASRTPTVGLE